MQYLEKSKFTDIFEFENFSYVLKKKKERENRVCSQNRLLIFHVCLQDLERKGKQALMPKNGFINL